MGRSFSGFHGDELWSLYPTETRTSMRPYHADDLMTELFSDTRKSVLDQSGLSSDMHPGPLDRSPSILLSLPRRHCCLFFGFTFCPDFVSVRVRTRVIYLATDEIHLAAKLLISVKMNLISL